MSRVVATRSATPEGTRLIRLTRCLRAHTGHAEAVLVEFDPAKVTYRELLSALGVARPDDEESPGPDVGDQLRSAVFTFSPEQKDGRARFESPKSRINAPPRSTTEVDPSAFSTKPRRTTAVRRKDGTPILPTATPGEGELKARSNGRFGSTEVLPRLSQ